MRQGVETLSTCGETHHINISADGNQVIWTVESSALIDTGSAFNLECYWKRNPRFTTQRQIEMQFLGFVDNGFRPENDIPDLSGKVILVTGGKIKKISSKKLLLIRN